MKRASDDLSLARAVVARPPHDRTDHTAIPDIRGSAASPMNNSFSQGLQDLRLHRIFRALDITGGTYAELGFPAVVTSNTERLKRSGEWTGVRIDGHCLQTAAENRDAQCHREWIRSDNVVPILRGHGVSDAVTYISIDLDTVDLWVLRALLQGSMRPAVLTVEYNSNYPLEFPIAFPDVGQHDDVAPIARKWDGDWCATRGRAARRALLACLSARSSPPQPSW